MERDAFASLFSQPQLAGGRGKKKGGKKPASSSSRTRSSRPLSSSSPLLLGTATPPAVSKGSRFIACPLCGKSVHSSLAQAHVERCIVEAVPPTKASSSTSSSSAEKIPPSPSSPSPVDGACSGTNDTGFLATAASSSVSLPLRKDPPAAPAPPATLSLGSNTSASVTPKRVAPPATGAAEKEKAAESSGHHERGAVIVERSPGAGPAPVPARTAREGAVAAAGACLVPRPSKTSSACSPTVKSLSTVIVNRINYDSNNGSGGRSAGNNLSNDNSSSRRLLAGDAKNPVAADTSANGRRNADTHTTTARSHNAFATLMAASALANFREEMYLWAHDDGTLSWGWGAAGNPLPPPPSSSTTTTTTCRGNSTNSSSSSSSSSRASGRGGGCGGSIDGGSSSSAPAYHRRWSCQVATKGPDGRKAGMCDIWTNLPSSPALTTPVAAALAGGGPGVEGRGGRAAATGTSPVGGDENVGLKAVHPGRSLSRLPVAVVKSMLQKNVRRGRAEAAVRCALELALRSWSDAIRRVLVIIVEDSLLHPASPLLSWLMVATSKGYRPPLCLLEAFLCVVHETAACPVRDSTDSCRRWRFGGHRQGPIACVHPEPTMNGREQQAQPQQKQPVDIVATNFLAEEFPIPHPRSVLCSGVGREGDLVGCGETSPAALAANAAVANIRRALLMRASYGGMAFDQALLKGMCLAWGERCGHDTFRTCDCPPASFSSAGDPASAATDCGECSRTQGTSGFEGAAQETDCMTGVASRPIPQPQHYRPPDPPKYFQVSSRAPGSNSVGRRCDGSGGEIVSTAPFGYAHETVRSALEGNGWTSFLAAAHHGTGMSRTLRSKLLAHVAGNGSDALGKPDDDGEHTGVVGGVKPQGPKRGRLLRGEGGGGRGGGGGGGGGGGAVVTCPTVPPSDHLDPIIREVDAILSGVDFHCTGVVDELLRSTAVAARVGTAIDRCRGSSRKKRKTHHSPAGAADALYPNPSGKAIPAAPSGTHGTGEISPDRDGADGATCVDVATNDRAYRSGEMLVGVRQAAKQAMWACSGGLNFRRLRVAFCSRRTDEARPRGVHDGMDEISGSSSCCWSSRGIIKEREAVGANGGDTLAPGSGNDQVDDVSPSNIDTMVWAAISSDVLSWTRRFVRARLSRG